MAMACLRLLTFPPLPPLPERSVPRFLRRIAANLSWLPFGFLPPIRGLTLRAGCAEDAR
jgi:hypothetical protein